MENQVRSEQQRHMVEEVGRYFEKQGFQPVAGRVLGLLLAMDKEVYTFEEITEELGISKSSTSVALRNLEIRGNIEYFTFPGDRKRYYRIRTVNPTVLIDEFEDKMNQFLRIHKSILNLKEDTNSRSSRFLKDLNKMIEFFLSHLDELKEKYQKQ